MTALNYIKVNISQSIYSLCTPLEWAPECFQRKDTYDLNPER